METKKIEVQSFLMQDTAKIMIDDQEKELWEGLVKKLNLKNQVLTKENPDIKNANPFLFLREQMKTVFETLCPIKMDYKDFDKGIIPTEILLLIDMAEQNKYFHEIKIWYDDVKPDPLCIGIKNGTYHSYKGNDDKDFANKEAAEDEGRTSENGFNGWYNSIDHFLIGRWGDEKKDLIQLSNEAADKFYKQQMNRINKEKDILKYSIFEKFGVEII